METSWGLALLFSFTAVLANDEPDIREPPGVLPPKSIPDKYYKSDGSVDLYCNATGVPPPTYSWYQDGTIIESNRPNVERLAAGNIRIISLSSLDEGNYQCVASNTWGKSVSQVFQLRRAFMGSFPADKQVRNFYGVEGEALKVERLNIRSVPTPAYTWKIVGNVDDKYPRGLELSDRIMEDLEGNLYFNWLTEADALDGKEFYKVEVFNNQLDSISGGSYSRVIVRKGVPNAGSPATLMYPSARDTKIVLEGDDLKLKCIFGGFPAVAVTWDGPNAPNKVVDGPNLIAKKASMANKGTYHCYGRNDEGDASATIEVLVQTIPKFTVIGKPTKKTMSEGDKAEFICQTTTDTDPKASIKWLINNVPIDDSHPGPRTEVGTITNGKVITIVDLKRDDIKVVQCNVSNAHGSLVADAPLNVLLRTRLTVKPEDQRVADNDTKVTFRCNATTDPSTKVSIKWIRDGKPISYYDDSNIIVEEGSLTVNLNNTAPEQRLSYAGEYTCNATNVYSAEQATAVLSFISAPVTPSPRTAAVSWLWLIILLVVVALLLFIFFLICCICMSRNKGGSYPVDEKERATGNDPVADLDKTGFHDYVRPPVAKRKGSRASLSSTVFMGSTSSLPDIGDFNEGGLSEDGSFIGMYTDDRRRLKPSYSEA